MAGSVVCPTRRAYSTRPCPTVTVSSRKCLPVGVSVSAAVPSGIGQAGHERIGVPVFGRAVHRDMAEEVAPLGREARGVAPDDLGKRAPPPRRLREEFAFRVVHQCPAGPTEQRGNHRILALPAARRPDHQRVRVRVIPHHRPPHPPEHHPMRPQESRLAQHPPGGPARHGAVASSVAGASGDLTRPTEQGEAPGRPGEAEARVKRLCSRPPGPAHTSTDTARRVGRPRTARR